MQAAYITQPGAASTIQIGDLPRPQPKPDECLVKVIAAAVDAVDTYVRAGTFVTPLPSPYVIGRDAIGTVVEVGTAVTDFAPGDKVWTNSMGYAGRQGITSEYAAIPAVRLWPAPAGEDPVALIASVHPAATAAIIGNQLLDLAAGTPVLIEGGAGHVGRALIQVAVARGAAVTATAAPKDHATLRRLGATPVNYAADWPNHLTEKMAVIIDTSGRVPLQTNLDALAMGGRIVLIAAPPAPIATVNVPQLYMQRQSLIGFVISHATDAELTTADAWVNHRLATRPLDVGPVTTLPFTQAAEAHRLLETHGTKARLVLMF